MNPELTQQELIDKLRPYISMEVLEMLLDDSSSSDETLTSSTQDSSSEEVSDMQDDACLAAMAISIGEATPKISHFIRDVVYSYTDEQFRRNFRVSRSVTNKLVEDFARSEYCPREDSPGIPAMTPEEHILSFLWYAGNKSSMSEVGNVFGMVESTFLRCSQRVMSFLIDIAPSVIRFPVTQQEKQQSDEEFRQIKGFPGVLGAVDGCYINIRTPAHKIRSTYVNRHDGISMTLQGICSANRMFVDAFTGCSSKMHDARVYKESYISKEIEEICEDGTYHLIGDSAYPLSPHLLTPYRYSELLTAAEQNYNRILCGTRVLIENTFGILKRRFRQLFMLEFWTVDKITMFILSCVILHNLCIIGDDVEDFFDVPENEWRDIPRHGPGYDEPEEENGLDRQDLLARGEQKREEIANML